MRVAISNAFLPTDQASGVPFQVHYLAQELSSRGHSVTIFTFTEQPADAMYKVHKFASPRLPKRLWPFVLAYKLAFTDFSNFDVIHTHGDSYLMWGTRHVRTFHGSAIDEFRSARTWPRRILTLLYVFLEWLAARVATRKIGVSETTRKRIPQIDSIIPCGVDLSKFQAGEKTQHPTIFFVGTEGGRKRGAWLAKVFKREVYPRLQSAELLMVSDSELREPGVTRLGRVSLERLAELYRSAWVFCLPSTYEGFGVPYIEAMAAGTSVVATAQNPGANEVLASGLYGEFVSDESLGEALFMLLSDAERRRHFQEIGRKRSKVYSWDAIAQQYEVVYGSMK